MTARPGASVIHDPFGTGSIPGILPSHSVTPGCVMSPNALRAGRGARIGVATPARSTHGRALAGGVRPRRVITRVAAPHPRRSRSRRNGQALAPLRKVRSGFLCHSIPRTNQNSTAQRAAQKARTRVPKHPDRKLKPPIRRVLAPFSAHREAYSVRRLQVSAQPSGNAKVQQHRIKILAQHNFFAGLMSQWSTAAACVCASAHSDGPAKRCCSWLSKDPAGSRRASETPSTNSSAR